jgi:DNA segregation ATPase FtsK/SpoIIIE, S-DNA-T family
MILGLLGLVTLLSLLSINRSSVTGAWIQLLTQWLGWGVYVLPAGLIVVGLWLILRNIEHLPQFAPERVFGIILLFLNMLAFLHLLTGDGAVIAQAGRGGGYLGNLILNGLTTTLGTLGGVVVLIAWLLIGLILTLDLTIPEMFAWTPPLFRKLGNTVKGVLNTLIALLKRLEKDPEENSHFPPDGFMPINRVNPPHSRAEGTDAESSGNPGAATLEANPMALKPTEWRLPPVEAILEVGTPTVLHDDLDHERAQLIEETLRSFGAPCHVVEIHRGPTITQFGVEPDFLETRSGRTRVRVSKIVALADDLTLALAAQRIRIQAPVPGRSYVGIEVPNSEVARVGLRDLIQSEGFKKTRSPLRFAIGKDVAGKPVIADLAAMPHLLIAGTTGSGKSVCVNSILSCLLLNNTPDDLRLILVDPKRVELTGYNGIPHLLAPVIVEVDRVVGALQWMMREMDNRYHKFAQVGARNITDYNERIQTRGEKKLPYLVIVIDELADLMMLAPDETERSITRLAQLARATGLHLMIATQRPSVDVITGLIKANFPARIAFAVASGVDSRVILDQPGAERLLGRGDMLFQAPDAPAPVRLQGVYVSDHEIQRLTEYWRGFAGQTMLGENSTGQGASALPPGTPLVQVPLWDEMTTEKDQDPMLKEATDLIRREGRASISMLQRRLRVGYSRAARIIDTLEEQGVIGPAPANTQVRPVLDYGPTVPKEEKE